MYPDLEPLASNKTMQRTLQQKALKMASEHLRHASASHTQACALQDHGQLCEAREQSRMTQVFLSNALYHLHRHAPDEA